MGNQSFFGINVQFASEPAADFGCDDAGAMFRNADHHRQLCLQQMRDLSRRPDHQFVFRQLRCGDRAAGFHRNRREPLIDESFFDDDLGVFERLFGVTGFETSLVGLVIGELFVDYRAAGFKCFLGIGYRRKRLIIDFDQVGCVARNVFVGGKHCSYGLSDEDHLARRKQRQRELLHSRNFAGNGYSHIRNIVGCDDGMHSGQLLSC